MSHSKVSFLEPLKNPPAYVMKKEGETLEVNLDIQYEKNAVFNFDKANNVLAKTRVFSSDKTREKKFTIVGPTLELRRNSTLIIHSHNKLPSDHPNKENRLNWPHGFNDYNLHTHGLHVSPQSPADNVCMTISPGQSFSNRYDIPANHPCGAYWYHPHKHGSVALQVGSGMAGTILMRGPFDDQLTEMGVKEYVIVFQNIATDENGVVESQDQVAKFPNSEYSILVNGQYCPVIHCQPGEVINLRFVNALTRSGLNFSFPRYTQIFMYSFDGNPFTGYQELDGIGLAPGNRASILLKIDEMATPGAYEYIYNDLSEYQQTHGYWYHNNCPLFVLAISNGKQEKVTTHESNNFSKATTVPPFPKTLIESDLLKPITQDEITNRRIITLQANKDDPQKYYGGFNLRIDHDVFKGCDHVNHRVELGAIEEWKIINNSYFPHPMHIHVNPYYIIEVCGESLLDYVPPVPFWADTFFVPAKGYVIFRSRFIDFTGKYPLHCHILYHEDGGMMQHVEVIDPTEEKKASSCDKCFM